MDKEIRYFVNGYEMLLYLSGDREERKSVDYFELQDFESEEEAVAAARDFISEHKKRRQRPKARHRLCHLLGSRR